MLTVFRCKLWLMLFFCFIAFGLNAQESDYDAWNENYKAGLKLKNSNNSKEALQYFEKAYALAKKIFTVEDVELGNIAFQLGEVNAILSNNKEAIKLIKASLKPEANLKDKKDSITNAIRLNALASIYFTNNKRTKAKKAYLKVLNTLNNKVADSNIEDVDLLDSIGGIFFNKKKFTSSIIVQKNELILIIEKEKSKSNMDYANALIEIAPAYRRNGEFGKAIASCKNALLIMESLGETQTKDYAYGLTTLAQVYNNDGKHVEEIALLNRSIVILEKLEIIVDVNYALALYSLGMANMSINNYDETVKLYKKSLEVLAEVYNKKHGYYLHVLNGLGLVYKRIGNYEKALELSLESISQISSDDEDYGTKAMNLAFIYSDLGEYDKALEYYLKAEKNMKAILGEGNSWYGKLLNNIGKFYFQIGETEKALQYFDRAKDNLFLKSDENHKDYGYYLKDISFCHLDLGNYDEAIAMMKDNIEIAKRNSDTNNEGFINRQYNLAFAYNTIGNYEEALPIAKMTSSKIKDILGEEHIDYANMLNVLSTAYLGLGNVEEAIPVIETSNKVQVRQLDKIFKFRSENEKKAFVSLMVKDFENLQSVSINLEENNQKLNQINLDNQLMLKGLLLNNSKDILKKLSTLNDTLVDSKIVTFRYLKTKLAKTLSQANSEREIDIDSLKAVINTKESELVKLYSSKFNDEISLLKDWKRSKTQLNNNEVAIEFSNFRLSRNNKLTDSIMYVAYVYNNKWQYPKMVTLFEENELKSIVFKPPNQLYNSNELYNLLWKPLESYIAKSNIIYYSPSGLLNQISFSAIKNETETLNNQYDLVQLSSTDILAQGITEPTFTSTLFIGGIDYDYTETVDLAIDTTQHAYLQTKKIMQLRGSKSRGESWDELPATLVEIESLQSILQSQGTGFNILKGKQATEVNFKKLSGNSPSILHIATHGFFYENREQKPKHTLGLSTEDQYRLAEDPLLRSGLILAGANYAWKHGSNNEDEDGILTALEISNMDLSNTDIVVLSACETGLGDVDGSEGVYGLQRAFKMAGVDIIVMSLWQVPDEETAEFMNLFYSNWMKSKNVRNAFNNAQRTMQNKYKNEPLKWAAFVMFE